MFRLMCHNIYIVVKIWHENLESLFSNKSTSFVLQAIVSINMIQVRKQFPYCYEYMLQHFNHYSQKNLYV